MGQATVNHDAQMSYYFLGRKVCRRAFGTLVGCGWFPRLSNIFRQVLSGATAARTDPRFLGRPFVHPRIKSGEVFSYLEELYESVAEPLPDDNDNRDQRFLPPGSISDLWKQFEATRGSCSLKLFRSVFVASFTKRLGFRSGFTHAVCAICTKHKLLIQSLAKDQHGLIKQRLMYERHLRDQYRDREVYWSLRGQSRLKSKSLTIIVDGVDQSKFCLPRSPFFQSKEFDGYQRPRLHTWGTIVHGHFSLLTLSDSNVTKGGSTTVEILAFVLTRLRRQGIDLSDWSVHVQLDNTASSNKNNCVLAFGAVMTLLGVVGTCHFHFLRAGHTHEACPPSIRLHDRGSEGETHRGSEGEANVVHVRLRASATSLET
jgi:hypothetical protein